MDSMLVQKLFLLLAFVALAESMGRIKVRHDHKDCSCEIHPEEEPCDAEVKSTTTSDDEDEPTTTKPTTTVTTTEPTTTETTTITTTTVTTAAPTTTVEVDEYGCPLDHHFIAFKRKSGYWCTLGHWWTPTAVKTTPMSRSYVENTCFLNGAKLSSIETEEEWDYWYMVSREMSYNVTAIWVAAEQDPVTKQYYWSDGYAIKTMDPQPVQEVVDGYVAYFPNKDNSTSGRGYLATTDFSGNGTRIVNMGICGRPGTRFS